VNVRQLIVGLYLLLFIGVGLASVAFFWQTREEYHRLTSLEESSQRRLAEAEARLRKEELILQRLQTDPVYVEKVIRLRLGYAKPEESIIRFPDN
jgi:cell division protein DivIC